MSAPPEYVKTVDETNQTCSKEECPPVYTMDVNNLTWQRSFPPTYDDEERGDPTSIDSSIFEDEERVHRIGGFVLSEAKSFLLCFFTVFFGLLIILPVLFFVSYVLQGKRDRDFSSMQ